VNKSNVVKTGKEQIGLILGHLPKKKRNCDNHRNVTGLVKSADDWDIPFRSIFDWDELKTVSLQSSGAHLGKMSSSQMEYFKSLMQETTQLVSNGQLFQLMLLVTYLRVT
jgi:hypothetical protein